MRKWALVAFVLSAATAGIVGCGGSSPRKVDAGAAGAGGSSGSGTAGADTGSAGATTGTAGAIGAAGAGTAGADAAAGTTGAAGATDQDAGTAGALGTAGAPAPYCDTHAQRALPYNIATDFKVVHILSNNTSAGFWTNVAQADCSDSPTYPSFPSPDAGVDATADAPADAPAEGGTTDGGVTDAAGEGGDAITSFGLAVDVDAGVDSVSDAASEAASEAGTDAVTTTADGGTDGVASGDGSVDAGAPGPACYEFSYDPDNCTGVACWAGVVFEVSDVQGPSTDTKGVCIAHGAMGIQFWARASKNGANVKFGSIGEGIGTTEYNRLLTTTWTRYFIAIGPTAQDSYDETAGDMQGVWNAFSVVVDPGDYVGGAYIEVKDISWIAGTQ
ncbi:MAG TPA: hypothetical protein VH560_13335 [Polyangia bacterium]|jgi:hypothetical protein|nr:hypothetical protein [Polyangia bacterium]